MIGAIAFVDARIVVLVDDHLPLLPGPGVPTPALRKSRP
jgi:hypothetical protein